jgi:hypothetical protein
MAQGSAKTIDACNTARMYVANNSVLILNLPEISKKRLRDADRDEHIAGLIQSLRAY